MADHDITLTVNDATESLTVESRTLLVHALRDDLDYTGPNVGCESGTCGACTVRLDGDAVKSCTVLAVQADGSEVTTAGGLAEEFAAGSVGDGTTSTESVGDGTTSTESVGDGTTSAESVGDGAAADDASAAADLHPIQTAFHDEHGLQCGYCTPGMVLTAAELLEDDPDPDREEIRHALKGNVCRCTGYGNVVDAVETAAERLASDADAADGADGESADPDRERAPAPAEEDD